MTGLDFTNLWGNDAPEQPETPQEAPEDTNQYIELKKEYQRYIQFNKEIDAQRKEVNKAMVQMIKDSAAGKQNDELLDDSLKIISALMRDNAFYIQMKNNMN